MSYNQNRLRFVHCETCFETSKQAREYVNGNLITNDRPSLYAEPMILKYGDPTNPNILLAIGSVGDGVTPSIDNKVFFIDCAQLDIDNNFEFINSNTIKFTVTKHKSGTTVGTNVLIEDKKNINDKEYENIITTSDNGLFSYVNTEIIGEKLIVNINGNVKEYTLPSALTSGEYNKDKLELILKTTNGEEIKINFNDVVSISNEEGNILLKKNDGLYANVELDYITSANTLSFKNSNIGKKDIELQTITSSTTKTIKNQVHIDNKNVQINSDVILSSDEQNIITVADDGLYANVKLEYNKATNTLKLITTSGEKEIQLSSHSLVNSGVYDPNTKEIVLTITYDSEEGEIVRQIRIPVSDLVNVWEVKNESTSPIILTKTVDDKGVDVLSASLQVSDSEDNMIKLKSVGSTTNLYARGHADSIKLNWGAVNENGEQTNEIVTIQEGFVRLQKLLIQKDNEINNLINEVNLLKEQINSPNDYGYTDTNENNI